MTDQSYVPPGVADLGEQVPAPRPVRPAPRTSDSTGGARPSERKRGLLATLDKPLLIISSMLLALGMIMVYSTTFDWSLQVWGSQTYIFNQHLRNLGVGALALTLAALIDYRIWRRLAVWLLLVTVGALIAVLLFGDDTFGARRALINGSLQPGEMAQLAIVIYMAAWMGSKGARIQSVTYVLLPFIMLVGLIGGLILLQPDLSTAVIIVISCGLMFILAGASIFQLGVLTILGSLGGVAVWAIASQRLIYAQDRVTSFLAGLTDLTQANYHTQQAVIAFRQGGLFGVGLGASSQKFGSLPVAHTDSIFAIIGEELGLVGATVVIVLYLAFVFRGFQIARRADQPFGMLLAAGITVWIFTQATINIAVMTALVPSTGVPLPFISFGGSSLVVVMIGVGLLLSVQRVTVIRQHAPEWRTHSASYDRGWRNRRARIPRPGRRRSDDRPAREGA